MRSDTPNLILNLAGGCSIPLSEVAERIRVALVGTGLQVSVKAPLKPNPEWEHGWDGFVSGETVQIRMGDGVPGADTSDTSR